MDASHHTLRPSSHPGNGNVSIWLLFRRALGGARPGHIHTIDIKLCKFWALICYCDSMEATTTKTSLELGALEELEQSEREPSFQYLFN